MKKTYKIKSNRYGHLHSFNLNKDGSYTFIPAEDWMPLYVGKSNVDSKEISYIDTEGGPFLTVGWSNDEIKITNIEIGKDNKISFTLKEVK